MELFNYDEYNNLVDNRDSSWCLEIEFSIKYDSLWSQ